MDLSKKLVLGSFAAATLMVTVGAPVAAEPVPGATCSMFPADSVFNTDVSTLPVHAQSAAWMGNMTQNSKLHPDFGTFAQEYGIPINVAPPPTTNLTPAFAYDSESDHPTEGYPISPSTNIEGGPSAPSGSDRHALVIDKNHCKLYELYNLQDFSAGQTPSAGSGAVWDLGSEAMRPDGWTSADAAGLPIAPLLLRPDEILAGSITHAIRFTAHCTVNAYIWPASHRAGSCATGYPPMGARFRLKQTYDISHFSANAQVVLMAFEHYGLILADNGSDWYFQGTTDDWWGTTAGSSLVSELKTIPASAFEAVDESALQVVAGSYQALQTGCVPAVSLPATETSTQFAVPVSAAGCAAAVSFDVQQLDSTLNQGWFWISAPAQGFPGHSYQFRARAHTTSAFVSAWSMPAATTVASTATLSHPFSGLYTLDAYGGVNAESSPPLAGSAYWAGWKIARGAHALPGSADSGLVIDGYGGFHAYGAALTASGAPYWGGWDIARDFAFLPDGTGGYLLDGYGGLHPFGVNGHAAPPAAHGSPYWGWDIARKVVINSSGTGGYVMDGYGGLHPFAIGTNAAPPAATGAAYWPGWKIARDVVLIPGTNAGFVLDGYGGLHGFNGAPPVSTTYWGWDIARSLWLLPGSAASAPVGYTLDGYGGLHPFGGAPAVSGPYWAGRDIARCLLGS